MGPNPSQPVSPSFATSKISPLVPQILADATRGIHSHGRYLSLRNVTCIRSVWSILQLPDATKRTIYAA